MKGLIILKAVVFGLILVFSQLGLADEVDLQSGPAVEVVNINHADAETIAMVLDGIGLARAEAIVIYREQNGDFTSLDDLVMVSGIGELTIQRNQDRIRFD